AANAFAGASDVTDDAHVTTEDGGRWHLFVLTALLLSVPFLLVRFPPITDLPQHLAQARLLHETIADPDGPYRIQWLATSSLQYVPLAAAWRFASAEDVARLAMIVLAILWTAATHWLAWKRQRPAAAAVLASVIFFNHGTYWGFYSFEIGWPVFVVWL